MNTKQLRLKKTGRQLSLFTEKDVRRSFLCRFSLNPKKQQVQKFRIENLHGVSVIPLDENSISAVSFQLHLRNRQSDFIKKKGRYFYN